jgi:hypothetical protein
MKRSVVVIAIIVIWILSGSWGFLVHRTVNQLAVYELPGNLRVIFYTNMDYIVRHSVRPDLRRNEDSTEDAKHYINFEAFGDSAAWKMPMVWEDAARLYSKDSLLKYGYVPYHIMVMKDRLTTAFRGRIKDSIMFYAADLAHYIGDAHVPLHTTTNYDGQLTNQKGLHSLWETLIPELELDQFDLTSRHHAKYLKHPEQSTWEALREAYILTTDIFMQEQDASKTFTDSMKYRMQVRRGKEVRTYSTEFAKAYGKRLGSTINGQLIKSAALIADFWYTCWVDAGKPDTRSLIIGSISDEQKRSLKKEYKAFKENKLLKEKLLISRENTNATAQ